MATDVVGSSKVFDTYSSLEGGFRSRVDVSKLGFVFLRRQKRGVYSDLSGGLSELRSVVPSVWTSTKKNSVSSRRKSLRSTRRSSVNRSHSNRSWDASGVYSRRWSTTSLARESMDIVPFTSSLSISRPSPWSCTEGRASTFR